MFLFFLTFEAGHVLKVVLKFWPNLRLNVLIKFVLKKTKKCTLNLLSFFSFSIFLFTARWIYKRPFFVGNFINTSQLRLIIVN